MITLFTLIKLVSSFNIGVIFNCKAHLNSLFFHFIIHVFMNNDNPFCLYKRKNINKQCSRFIIIFLPQTLWIKKCLLCIHIYIYLNIHSFFLERRRERNNMSVQIFCTSKDKKSYNLINFQQVSIDVMINFDIF